MILNWPIKESDIHIWKPKVVLGILGKPSKAESALTTLPRPVSLGDGVGRVNYLRCISVLQCNSILQSWGNFIFSSNAPPCSLPINITVKNVCFNSCEDSCLLAPREFVSVRSIEKGKRLQLFSLVLLFNVCLKFPS